MSLLLTICKDKGADVASHEISLDGLYLIGPIQADD